MGRRERAVAPVVTGRAGPAAGVHVKRPRSRPSRPTAKSRLPLAGIRTRPCASAVRIARMTSSHAKWSNRSAGSCARWRAPSGAARFSQSVSLAVSKPPRIDGVFVTLFRFLQGKVAERLGQLESAVSPALLAGIDTTPFFGRGEGANEREDCQPALEGDDDLEASAPSRHLLKKSAGPDGMSEGAFTIPGGNDVIVCPGTLCGREHWVARTMKRYCPAYSTSSGTRWAITSGRT